VIRSLDHLQSKAAHALESRGVGGTLHEREYPIEVVDVATLTRSDTWLAHSHLVHGLTFSRDGEQLLSASRDQFVGLWDVKAGALVSLLAGHSACVYSALFLSDPRRAVSGGLDGRLLSWDLETGVSVEIGRHEPPPDGRGGASIHGLARRGDVLMSGGTGVLWWDPL
jgi:WD40 repeat protein